MVLLRDFVLADGQKNLSTVLGIDLIGMVKILTG